MKRVSLSENTEDLIAEFEGGCYIETKDSILFRDQWKVFHKGQEFMPILRFHVKPFVWTNNKDHPVREIDLKELSNSVLHELEKMGLRVKDGGKEKIIGEVTKDEIMISNGKFNLEVVNLTLLPGFSKKKLTQEIIPSDYLAPGDDIVPN